MGSRHGAGARKQKVINMTYKMNTENTGLDTDDQVKVMVSLMQDDGYDVEYTHDFGLVNPAAECPVTDKQWEKYLIAADAAA